MAAAAETPPNLAALQMFKSPSEGIAVLLRNKQLLGQNSLSDPRVDRQQWCRTSSGELMLGWFRRLPGGRTISSNRLGLNVRQALAKYTNFGEHLMHVGVRREPD